MRARLFKSIFFVCMAVFLVSLVTITAALHSAYLKAYESELQEETNYLASAIDSAGVSFLAEFENQRDKRILWMAQNGEVFYDSWSGAMTDGMGEMIACTAALPDGSVVLVYSGKYTMLTLVTSVFYPMFTLILLAFVLSIALAHRVSKQVMAPISSVNLEMPDDGKVYDELKPLLRRIREQNRKIYDQMDELKREHGRRDSMRREFTANVSHELKTPLTSISGYAEILRDGVVSDEDISPFAGKIYDEAQRMSAIVGDILRLSELETKELEVTWEVLDVFGICGEVCERLGSIAKGRGIRLLLEGSGCEITAVRRVVEDIAFNLCDNAIKYNRDGGEVRICVFEEGQLVTLRVSDTGIGIARMDKERIFERFYRVDKSRSRQIGGTGLGLSIVKHGALLHGAEISVESDLGRGTSISVSFPKNAAGASARN